MMRVDWGGAARREGEGAREEGGSRHLGASSRHNKAPGEREDFVPGRGGARLVAVRTGQGGHGCVGARRGGRCRRVAPRGLRQERGPERGLAAPRAGRGRPGGPGLGAPGAAGPGDRAGRSRAAVAPRRPRRQAAAAPLLAGGRCWCGAAAIGGRRRAHRSAPGLRSAAWAHRVHGAPRGLPLCRAQPRGRERSGAAAPAGRPHPQSTDMRRRPFFFSPSVCEMVASLL